MATQRNKLNLIILSGILFAIYCFVFGDSGLIARIHLGNEKRILQLRIANLREENLSLSEILKSYRRGDFLKEEAVKSGYIEKGEKILFMRESEQKKSFGLGKKDKRSVNGIELSHLKILWIVVSAMILMLYIIKRKRSVV